METIQSSLKFLVLYIFLCMKRNIFMQCENIAVGKPSWISDWWDGGRPASHLNDGERFNTGSHELCSTTNGGHGWWKADLLHWYNISDVRLTAVSGYGGRMKGLELRIGSRKDFENELCYKIPSSGSIGDVLNVTCDTPIIGRYFTISTTQLNLRMTLCEIEIFSSLEVPSQDGIAEFNVAENKPAEVSYDVNGVRVAANAVDGNLRMSDCCRDECLSTESGAYGWWKVDLQKTYNIHALTFYTMIDRAQYNDGVEVRIGTEDSVTDNPLCRTLSSSDFGVVAVKRLPCVPQSLAGSYVSLQTTETSTEIAMCEIQVWSYRLIISSNLYGRREINSEAINDASNLTCDVIYPRPGGNFLDFHLNENVTSKTVSIVTSNEASCAEMKIYVNIGGVFYSSSEGSLFNCGQNADVIHLPSVSKYACVFTCTDIGRTFSNIMLFISASSASEIDICDFG